MGDGIEHSSVQRTARRGHDPDVAIERPSEPQVQVSPLGIGHLAARLGDQQPPRDVIPDSSRYPAPVGSRR